VIKVEMKTRGRNAPSTSKSGIDLCVTKSGFFRSVRLFGVFDSRKERPPLRLFEEEFLDKLRLAGDGSVKRKEE
jgi:hypothetical protein